MDGRLVKVYYGSLTLRPLQFNQYRQQKFVAVAGSGVKVGSGGGSDTEGEGGAAGKKSLQKALKYFSLAGGCVGVGVWICVCGLVFGWLWLFVGCVDWCRFDVHGAVVEYD